MKKYRIKKVNHTLLGPLYYPQKRVFLFFWENVYPSRSLFVGYYPTYDEALENRCPLLYNDFIRKYCK